MVYTLKQIASLKGVSRSTARRYLKTLVKLGVFVKTSPGRVYSEREVEMLAELLDFRLPDLLKKD